jgi:hypothetical protein
MRAGDAREVTADFLPLVPGRVRTHDLAMFSEKAKLMTRVERRKWYHLKDSIETLITHRGRLFMPTTSSSASSAGRMPSA